MTHAPGVDHFGHQRHHHDHSEIDPNLESGAQSLVPESYAAQMTALFILEFGVIFHSVFIGLALAVSGSEFNTLYVVLVFHQTFEGLGLGSRLATAPWPKNRRWTPYIMAVGYALSTPIAIAIGLGVRTSYAPGTQTALITNGVFDSISAGILIYTGLVELMAHEFMFSPAMQRAPLATLLSAFGLMCLGAGLMALLGKWA
ncbi:MAG: ZIP family metal transporter [Terriglobus roseus]|nr:ZIP family metal transporter [Terriglobus roseus]